MIKSDTAEEELEEFLSSLLASLQSWSADSTTSQSWSSLTLLSSSLLYSESDVSDRITFNAATELAWHSAIARVVSHVTTGVGLLDPTINSLSVTCLEDWSYNTSQ